MLSKPIRTNEIKPPFHFFSLLLGLQKKKGWWRWWWSSDPAKRESENQNWNCRDNDLMSLCFFFCFLRCRFNNNYFTHVLLLYMVREYLTLQYYPFFIQSQFSASL